MATSLFAGLLAPKDYDTIELLSTPAKPTKVVYKKKSEIVRELKLTYEGATENIEKVEVVV